MGSWNPTIWKPKTLEIQTFWRLDFKWSGFSYGYTFSPNRSKTGTLKIHTFLSRFQIVFDKLAAIFLISNGSVSWFQLPFKICTICNPISFWPFSKSRFVGISNPHCNCVSGWFKLVNFKSSVFKWFCNLKVINVNQQKIWIASKDQPQGPLHT